MCFLISEKHPNPQIAKKDIRCYKLVLASKYANKPWFVTQDSVKPAYYSQYREFRYVEGEEYVIKDGLQKAIEVQRFSKIKFWRELNSIEEGFHSYENLSILRGPSRFDEHDNILSVVEFYIPEGATYYYNEIDKVYVSDRISCVRGISPLHYLWLSIISIF